VLSIDPDRPTFVSVWGRMESGKSVLARSIVDQWPYRRLVIDVTHDIEIEGELITDDIDRWPPNSQTLRFRPPTGRGRAAQLDSIDRVLGLARSTGDVLVWADEIGVIAPTHQQQAMPSLFGILMHGRHDRVSLVAAGPRPANVDPLVLSQSAYVAIFQLPNPKDRQRIADESGIPLAVITEGMHALAEHEFLLIKQKTGEVFHYDAIPN
jgi:hypothetical protein